MLDHIYTDRESVQIRSPHRGVSLDVGCLPVRVFETGFALRKEVCTVECGRKIVGTGYCGLGFVDFIWIVAFVLLEHGRCSVKSIRLFELENNLIKRNVC